MMTWRHVLIGLIMFFGRPALNAQPDIRQLLDAYYPIREALVGSNSRATAGAAQKLQQVLDAQPGFTEQRKLQEAVRRLAGTTDLARQRSAFGELSVELWPLVKKAPSSGATVYYQFCPMEKAYWLSPEEQIRNPFFGSRMLTCGRTIERKE